MTTPLRRLFGRRVSSVTHGLPRWQMAFDPTGASLGGPRGKGPGPLRAKILKPDGRQALRECSRRAHRRGILVEALLRPGGLEVLQADSLQAQGPKMLKMALLEARHPQTLGTAFLRAV